jgi:hypothetical protein
MPSIARVFYKVKVYIAAGFEGAWLHSWQKKSGRRSFERARLQWLRKNAEIGDWQA